MSRATLVTLCWSLLACTSSDPTTKPTSDAAAETSALCTLSGGKCVASTGLCCEQWGTLFDEARNCRTTIRAIIGCPGSPMPAHSACFDLGIIGCAITHEGGVRRVWMTSSRAVGWEPSGACPSALMVTIGSAPPCGDNAGP